MDHFVPKRKRLVAFLFFSGRILDNDKNDGSVTRIEWEVLLRGGLWAVSHGQTVE
jgi:hypothetical protein